MMTRDLQPRGFSGDASNEAGKVVVEWSPVVRRLVITVHECTVADPLDWVRSALSVDADLVVDLRTGRHEERGNGVDDDGDWRPGTYYLG